ncbi:MAG: DUF1761 domain-containing protein [Hyphomicrobiaceae bacterium]
MDFAGLNYIAVLVAAAVSFMFGGIWYGALANPWMAAAGIDEATMAASKEAGKTTMLMIRAFLGALVMAWVLAGLIGHLGSGQVTIYNGLISGAFVWLGFVATTLVTNHGFQMQSFQLTLIDGGHWLGVLLIQGAVIGAFGS